MSGAADGPVVIFTEDADWHTTRLKAAVEAKGFDTLVLSLNECGFAIGQSVHGLSLPGLGDRLPAAAFVRLIAKGTTEQITTRLGLLHALREHGVKVMNDARAIERCVDKAMTSFLLARAGLPTPRTFVGEGREAMQAHMDAASGEMVLKPLFGAQGRGVRRLAPRERLPEPETLGGVYYLQDFIGDTKASSYHDWRIFVTGGEVTAAMIRRSPGWITNIHQGAEGEPAPRNDLAHDLAIRACATVGADYGGVDLIEDGKGGFLVLEVNSMPAWQGLQKTTDTDIATALAAHLARTLTA